MNSLLSDDSSSPARTGQPTGSGDAPTEIQVDAAKLAPALVPDQDRTVISQKPVAMPSDFVRSLSLVELAKSLEGRSLHHFSVDRMIGGGGMGAVFRGRDQRLDREVAIKVIPESRRDPETLRRFRMEAQSAARLDHPNIARVYDIGEDEAWNYIVFEFIDGINLRDLVLTYGPMSIDDAVFTTRQVAEALQHAHDRDVVHRDIKPSNVIITPTGIAKVVDMGLARNTSADQSSADQTASGVTLGTFDYISPEQARDPRDADVRSDLYSLGCTLFFMLTGQPPFPEGTALQKLLNHGSQPPPDPRQWRDDISDQLAAVLSKLMAKRATDRYQKPIELINDLMLIAQIESLPRSRSAGTILMRPTIARRSLLETHLPWLVPLCVLIGSAAWLQSSDSWAPPLEIPQPNLIPTQSLRYKDAPPNAAPAPPSLPPDQRTTDQRTTDQRTSNPRAPEERSTDQQIAERRTAEPRATEQRPPEQPGPESPSLEPRSPDKRIPDKSLTASEVTKASPSEPRTVSDAASAETKLDPKPAEGLAGSTTPNKTRELPNTLTSGASSTAAIAVDPAGMLANATATPESFKPSLPSPELDRRQPSSATTPDVIRVGGSATASLGNLSRWAPNLPAALMQAAMQPDIRIIELNESVQLTSSISLPRSGLTIRSAPGVNAELVLSGADAFGIGWEGWIDVDRKQLRCQSLRIKCLNDMHQPQAIFMLRGGGRIDLDSCEVTMLSSRDSQVGSCVVVKEPARARPGAAVANPASTGVAMPPTLMPSTSATTVMPTIMPGQNETPASEPPTSPAATPPAHDDEPIAIVMRDCVIRGAMSMLTMRSVTRAEITIEKTCALLDGRVLTVRTTEDERVPPVIRMSLQQSTFATNLGFLAIVTGSGTRAPLTLMRTANLCAFWSPVTVPHIAIDGLDNEDLIDKLLLLRGEENAYDQNVDTLCQCRLADGQNLDFTLDDITRPWFRELGNEHELRWQDSLPTDLPMHEQVPAQYRLRDSMFMPGYR